MKNWHIFLWIVISALGGFVLGDAKNITKQEPAIITPVKSEKSTVTFFKLEGDTLSLLLEGNVRVIWSEEHFLDKSGNLFLGQVPNARDLQFRQYPFVGNANTGKFYPSTTSWARGVRVKDRRFFTTKELAIDAGFIPSKSVK
jgi:hypothetical protein